jgi:hypothetical protein
VESGGRKVWGERERETRKMGGYAKDRDQGQQIRATKEVYGKGDRERERGREREREREEEGGNQRTGPKLTEIFFR